LQERKKAKTTRIFDSTGILSFPGPISLISRFITVISDRFQEVGRITILAQPLAIPEPQGSLYNRRPWGWEGMKRRVRQAITITKYDHASAHQMI
jgi:hypothetical protein